MQALVLAGMFYVCVKATQETEHKVNKLLADVTVLGAEIEEDLTRNVNIFLDLLQRTRNTLISQERYEDAEKIQNAIDRIVKNLDEDKANGKD